MRLQTKKPRTRAGQEATPLARYRGEGLMAWSNIWHRGCSGKAWFRVYRTPTKTPAERPAMDILRKFS